jgi:cell shape-determining protein MreC
VAETAADRKGSFMKIRLTPAAHLDRLEEVLVLLTRQDLDVK